MLDSKKQSQTRVHTLKYSEKGRPLVFSEPRSLFPRLHTSPRDLQRCQSACQSSNNTSLNQKAPQQVPTQHHTSRHTKRKKTKDWWELRPLLVYRTSETVPYASGEQILAAPNAQTSSAQVLVATESPCGQARRYCCALHCQN